MASIVGLKSNVEPVVKNRHGRGAADCYARAIPYRRSCEIVSVGRRSDEQLMASIAGLKSNVEPVIKNCHGRGAADCYALTSPCRRSTRAIPYRRSCEIVSVGRRGDKQLVASVVRWKTNVKTT